MVQLNGEFLSLETIQRVAKQGEEVSIHPDALARMAEGRAVIDDILSTDRVVYGVNTGFGKLADIVIPPSQLKTLQLNLVRSHACGVGRPLSEPEVRAMMLLRLNVLLLGRSGARPLIAQRLAEMLNEHVHPVVPEKGSVGASGDLAPLAHLALGVIGEGHVIEKGQAIHASEGATNPVELEAKEGLSLLNGTQAIGAVGSLALSRGLQAVMTATLAGAMSLEAVLGTDAAFDSRIHTSRHHQGQMVIAQVLRSALEGSEIRESHREGDPRVQDAYCLRCMPQVHGAALLALEHVASIFENETAAATDNPLVFTEGDVISGGNFHAAPLAYALDYAAIVLTDLASISERRIDRLINPDLNEGLPAFLTQESGVGSGFMMAHVTAVALLNECKVLSHPASVDNAPTSGGKEDHVSMGMTAALKFRQIVENVETILAIELLCAAQGLEFRRPLRAGAGVERAYAWVRKAVPALETDRILSTDIERIRARLTSGDYPA
jgi:histidine ammonia-lyase